MNIKKYFLLKKNCKELSDNVTIMIKTFLRPYCIKECINSIRKYYPYITIMVADDSDEPLHPNNYVFDNVYWYVLPFDSGLSAGRNLLLTKVKTKYFFVCDDDTIFTENTKLDVLYDVIKNTDYDIVGGYLKNCDYCATFEKNNNNIIVHSNKYHSIQKYNNIELKISDRVLNFFMANTKIIREKNNWINELKLREHTMFFIEAYFNKLKICSINITALHSNNIYNKRYGQYRARARTNKYIELNKKIIKEKYNIDNIIIN